MNEHNLIQTQISAKNLPEAWFKCIRALMTNEHGIHRYRIDSGSYAGQERIEFDYITVSVEYPGRQPIIPDLPQGIPNPSNTGYLERYITKLMTSQKDENEQYTYGEYLEKQIPHVIEKYKYGPGNNQCYMTVGDQLSIYQSDPPCLRGIDTRILNGYLHFIVYFRSWDLWAGFPNNLGALQYMKEYMASEIGVADGTLIASSKGLHLYDYSWQLAKQVINR